MSKRLFRVDMPIIVNSLSIFSSGMARIITIMHVVSDHHADLPHRFDHGSYGPLHKRFEFKFNDVVGRTAAREPAQRMN